ncbi:MAG: Uma2 family endonuclease [Prochlorothrix sp.]|nr:Uma2 family endonuclease [Prochlorothrix sp.]
MIQHSPPLAPHSVLPTMYDLPSEDPEEPGLPDEFHLLQPELLRQTFQPPTYNPGEVFAASDLNLYYDLKHPQWYKRPDWFGVVGVPRLYDERDLRLSYVIWQEGVAPLVVVELASPGTEDEDLGRRLRSVDQPPNKWTVYEQILRIPYYFLFNRYTDEFQAFGLMMTQYQPLDIEAQGVWLPEAGLGLGLWFGRYQGIERRWLRWYDAGGNWLPTLAEAESRRAEQERRRAEQEKSRAEQEKQRAEQERQRAEQEKQRADFAEQENTRLREQLRSMGVDLP